MVPVYGEFPKLGVRTTWVAPTMGTVVFWGLYKGSLFWEATIKTPKRIGSSLPPPPP